MRPFVAVTGTPAGTPPVYRARHQDLDPPFRASPKALVVRVGFGRALVFGWWRRTGFRDEEQALGALGFRGHERIESNVRSLIVEEQR